MDKIFKNKKLIIIVSIIVAVSIAIATVAVIIMLNNNNHENSNPSTEISESPTFDYSASSQQVTTAQLNNFFANRPEKNVKAFPIVNEFFSPNYEKKIFKDSKSGKELRYCLYLPENYSKSKKYPVLLFMHGLGCVGTDFVSSTYAIKPAFANNADILKTAIIVAPQTADSKGYWPINDFGNDQNGWGAIAMRLLLDVEKNYSCDKNRIYITGNSMGGHGTWNILETYGEHFAAGVPICGWGDPSKASKLKDIPIWTHHGDADPTVPVEASRSMYNAIKAAGGTKIKYTELPGVNHDSWTQAYESREVLSWLFSQNKATNKTADYNIFPYMKIVDNNNKTIITEKDTSLISFTTVSEQDCIELTLTDNGAKKLESAYKNSIGKTFNMYYGNKKIMSFTASKGSVDKKFYIVGVFDSYNYFEYTSRLGV